MSNVFWSVDYSGLEIVIAAALSQDPEMLSILGTVCSNPPCQHKPKCGDLHSAFQIKIKELSGVLVPRVVAKNGNFLLLYEGYADKLITTLALQGAYIDYPTALVVIKTHNEMFSRYHEWGREMVALARGCGYAMTYDGRKRLLPELYSPDERVRGTGERAAINTCVQGTAADKMKWLMGACVPLLRQYGAHISNQVHDELCGWVAEENAHSFIRELTALGSSVMINGVNLKLEGGYGRTWADAKAA